MLLLLDTWCPTLAGVLHYRHIERAATLLAARRAVARRGIAEVGRVLRDHVRDRPPFGPVRSLRYAVNVARTLARVGRPWVSAVNAVGKPASGMERIAAAEANYVERTMRYRPRPYPGQITLIVSAGSDRLGLANAWRALAGGGLVVRTVPGDHDSYLQDTPELAAAMLEDALDGTLGTGAPYGSTPRANGARMTRPDRTADRPGRHSRRCAASCRICWRGAGRRRLRIGTRGRCRRRSRSS